jgi:hypothetical protein
VTRPDGTPDPGAPEATDEEAFEAAWAEEAPVAPEAAAVADESAGVGVAEIEETTADDETARGEFQ